MPLPSVTFRSELDPIVRKELDQLDGEITEYLLQEHDDDGKHTHITADSITVTGGTNLTSPVTIDGVPVTGAQPSASTFFYRADVTFQSAQDPGSGRLRWNTVNQHLATALYVDRLTDDGFDAMLFLELSHIADRFVLQDANLSASYQVWHLTGPAIDHVDWFELPVAFESSGGPGTFGQLDRIAMLLQTGGGSGGTAPHHVTHEPGGADAIVGAAWTNQANVFTQNQTISKVDPILNLIDTDAPANARLFRLTNQNQLLYLQAVDDAVVTTQGSVVVSRAGALTVEAHAQVLGKDVYLGLVDGTGVLLRNSGTVLHVLTGTAGGYVSIGINDLGAGGVLRERGRSLPLGEWQDEPFNAANFTAPAGMTWTVTAGAMTTNRYCLMGKTLIWQFATAETTVGGTPLNHVFVRLPAGITAARYGTAASSQILNQGTNHFGMAYWSAGTNLAVLYTPNVSAWTAGYLYLRATMIIEFA
jgi:hypothetical protein